MVEKEKSSALPIRGGEKTDGVEDEPVRGNAMEKVLDFQGHEREQNGAKGTVLDPEALS